MCVWSFPAASVARPWRLSRVGSPSQSVAESLVEQAARPAVEGGGWLALSAPGRASRSARRCPLPCGHVASGGRLLIIGRPPRRPAADRARSSIPVHGRFSGHGGDGDRDPLAETRSGSRSGARRWRWPGCQGSRSLRHRRRRLLVLLATLLLLLAPPVPGQAARLVHIEPGDHEQHHQAEPGMDQVAP
jgi:hypothetical protein